LGACAVLRPATRALYASPIVGQRSEALRPFASFIAKPAIPVVGRLCARFLGRWPFTVLAHTQWTGGYAQATLSHSHHSLARARASTWIGLRRGQRRPQEPSQCNRQHWPDPTRIHRTPHTSSLSSMTLHLVCGFQVPVSRRRAMSIRRGTELCGAKASTANHCGDHERRALAGLQNQCELFPEGLSAPSAWRKSSPTLRRVQSLSLLAPCMDFRQASARTPTQSCLRVSVLAYAKPPQTLDAMQARCLETCWMDD